MSSRPAAQSALHLGRAIRSARLGRAWTQEELACRAGLNRSYIAEIERGSRNLSLAAIVKLQGSLDLALDSILRDADVTVPAVPTPPTTVIDPARVAVFYGRHEEARQGMLTFLRAIGLNPYEWEEMVGLTQKGSPYIGEVVATTLRTTQAAIVLLTPDDQVRLRGGFGDQSSEDDYSFQPRQNVLIELGMALSWDESRTIIVELGELRPATDVLGRHVVQARRGRPWREQLSARLITAGCAVAYKDGWLTAPELEQAEQ